MGKQRGNPVTDAQIIDHYEQSHSVYTTAEVLGIGSTTAHRVLMKHGVPRVGLAEWRKNATKFKGQEDDIRRAYESGMTMQQLREQFGEASTYAFKYALRRAGGVLRENTAPLIQPGELEKIRELNAAGMGQMAISLEIGRSQSFVSRAMRKHGIAPGRNSGPGSSNWKGGRYLDSNGYVRAWVPSDDPLSGMALNTGHVLEHRLVLARKLGRPLLSAETVHHIDGDRTNNAPENLELRQGKHGKHVVLCCLDCGSRNIGPAKLG